MLGELSLGNSPVSLFKLLSRLNWSLCDKAVNIIFDFLRGEVAITYAKGSFPGQLSSELVQAAVKIEPFLQGCKYYFYILKGEVVIIHARGTSLDNSPMSLFELLSRLNWSLFDKAVIIIFCLRERLL